MKEQVHEGAHDPVVAGEDREDLFAVAQDRIVVDVDVVLRARVDAERAAAKNGTGNQRY